MTNNNSGSWLKDLLILTLVISILFGAFLGSRPLGVPDEARYAEIPREMLVTGDYVTPHLNYLKYFEKPPLVYWLQAAAIKMFGINEWSLRIVNALLGLSGCLMTYGIALKLYGRSCGLLASIILATSTLYFVMAHYLTLDMSLAILLTASFYSFLAGIKEGSYQKRRYWMWCMYAFAALAVLTKGLIGIALPAMVIGIWVIVYKKWQSLPSYRLVSGIILMLIIAAPWHILVQLKNPEFSHFYFIEQHVARYFTKYAGREQPIWYLPLVLGVGFFPWIGFLFQTLFWHGKRLWQDKFQEEHSLLLILWAVLIYTFFQLSHSQLPPYLLPIFPPLAILTANYIVNSYSAKAWNLLGFCIISTFAIIIAGGALIFNDSNLIIYAIIVLLMTTISATILQFYNYSQRAIGILIMGISGFLMLLNLIYIENYQYNSIKPLAQELKKILKPQDEVISYNEYYQDLPLYLQGKVTVVNYKGELAFGTMQHPNPNWMIDDKTLWQKWHSPQRLFMVISKKEYQALLANKPPQLKFYILAETKNKILVTNQKMADL